MRALTAREQEICSVLTRDGWTRVTDAKLRMLEDRKVEVSLEAVRAVLARLVKVGVVRSTSLPPQPGVRGSRESKGYQLV